jgi:hypothetical protein
MVLGTEHEVSHYTVFSTHYHVLRRSNYLPKHRILKHLQPMVISQCETKFHKPIQNKSKIVILYILILIILDSQL